MKKPSRKTIRSLCSEVSSDDGIDPRQLVKQHQKASRSGTLSRAGRKAMQLGRQVAETLDAVLAGESRDEILQGLCVVSVIPAPDASRLIVTVAPLPPFDRFDPDEVLGHLNRASGRLRSEVASAITRKHAPTLTYRIALPSTPEPEGS